VRIQFVIGFATALVLAGCTIPKATHVEVTTKLYWHEHDYAGGPPGSADYHEITNYWVTNYYAPFIVTQGSSFSMDFVNHDSFISPDTQRNEEYFDGVLAHLSVTVSNTTACFSGRAEYHLHLGVTSSYLTDDGSLYGETLRSYSTRFRGSCSLGHEMQIGTGEDINDEPIVCITFRTTSAPLSKFNQTSLNYNDPYSEMANPYRNIDDGTLHVIGSDYRSKRIVRELEYYVALCSTYPTNHFYVGATQLNGKNLVKALAYWKEPRVIMEYGELTDDTPEDAEIFAWQGTHLKLGQETVDTPDDINGSTYLETHSQWVNWMEQCIYGGKSYIITLNEATNTFPNMDRSKADNE
jgi:hypothetical protein